MFSWHQLIGWKQSFIKDNNINFGRALQRYDSSINVIF